MQVEKFRENYADEDKSPYTINKFPTELDQAINNIIDKEEYLTYKVHKQVISTNGENYLGVLYEVDVRGKTKHGDKETNLFVKLINGVNDMSMLSIPNVYRVEFFFYKELTEIFAELQEDANVPAHERFKIVKCYEGSSTEAIILENVARKGYNTYPRMHLVPLEFIEMSIKELAKLHGLSFALQEKRPDYCNRKIKNIKYAVNFGDDWRGFVNSMFNLIMQNVDDDVKDRVENTYYKVTDKFVQYMKDEALKACLCHGDYKPNNIMTKIVNGQPTDIIPVDFQILSYSCPVFDFVYFLFTSTDRRFRKAHLSQLKDLYHESLRTFLGYFNIDVDLVYPRERFEAVYKEKLDYGLAICYLYMPFTFASEDDVPDLAQDLSGISFQVTGAFKQRLRDVIDDFIDSGYI